jgi:hypothetical protein
MRVDVSVRPVDAPGAKDTTWYTTVSGIVGDALAPPRGDVDVFGAQLQGGPGAPGNPGTPGGPGTPGNPSNGEQPGQNNGSPRPPVNPTD